MLRDIDAAIFDLDGTLVDSMGIWGDIDVEYLKRYNLEVPIGLQEAVEGLAFTEVACYFKEHFPIDDSIEDIKATWNDMAKDKYLYEVPTKPGIEHFLPYLQEQGIVMGVASSNSIELVEAALAGHQLRDYFQCVLTCCDVEKGKPEPDVYLEVARRLGVEPSRCIVFEDIPVGIMAGIRAGMRTCAVEDAYSAGYEQEKRSLADYYIMDYSDIIRKQTED